MVDLKQVHAIGVTYETYFLQLELTLVHLPAFYTAFKVHYRPWFLGLYWLHEAAVAGW